MYKSVNQFGLQFCFIQVNKIKLIIYTDNDDEILQFPGNKNMYI